jgi:hypothetical protein
MWLLGITQHLFYKINTFWVKLGIQKLNSWHLLFLLAIQSKSLNLQRSEVYVVILRCQFTRIKSEDVSDTGTVHWQRPNLQPVFKTDVGLTGCLSGQWSNGQPKHLGSTVCYIYSSYTLYSMYHHKCCRSCRYFSGSGYNFSSRPRMDLAPDPCLASNKTLQFAYNFYNMEFFSNLPKM